jgi:hypothetical protein
LCKTENLKKPGPAVWKSPRLVIHRQWHMPGSVVDYSPNAGTAAYQCVDIFPEYLPEGPFFQVSRKDIHKTVPVKMPICSHGAVCFYPDFFL